jgi:hypothetical protein
MAATLPEAPWSPSAKVSGRGAPAILEIDHAITVPRPDTLNSTAGTVHVCRATGQDHNGLETTKDERARDGCAGGRRRTRRGLPRADPGVAAATRRRRLDRGCAGRAQGKDGHRGVCCGRDNVDAVASVAGRRTLSRGGERGLRTPARPRRAGLDVTGVRPEAQGLPGQGRAGGQPGPSGDARRR